MKKKYNLYIVIMPKSISNMNARPTGARGKKVKGEINPNFIIRIACPIHNAYEHERCNKEKRHKAEEIASRYFGTIIRNEYFSERIIMRRYQIEKGKNSHLKLVKSWEHERTKEAMKYA